ncbi:MAG: hypothetical protein ACW98X_21950 [Promethearchaeota archaeon]|jgi:hypothetical protein
MSYTSRLKNIKRKALLKESHGDKDTLQRKLNDIEYGSPTRNFTQTVSSILGADFDNYDEDIDPLIVLSIEWDSLGEDVKSTYAGNLSSMISSLEEKHKSCSSLYKQANDNSFCNDLLKKIKKIEIAIKIFNNAKHGLTETKLKKSAFGNNVDREEYLLGIKFESKYKSDEIIHDIILENLKRDEKYYTNLEKDITLFKNV